METRFPISRDSGQVHINFVWYDAFRHSKKTEQCSIHFEKAAVLFNLAAVMTQQALNADRATDAGRKEAAKYFQVGILALGKMLPESTAAPVLQQPAACIG